MDLKFHHLSSIICLSQSLYLDSKFADWPYVGSFSDCLRVIARSSNPWSLETLRASSAQKWGGGARARRDAPPCLACPSPTHPTHAGCCHARLPEKHVFVHTSGAIGAESGFLFFYSGTFLFFWGWWPLHLRECLGHHGKRTPGIGNAYSVLVGHSLTIAMLQ